MLASAVINRAAVLLQDTTNVRWPRLELLDWLNDAALQIVMLRPDSSVANASVTLIAGTKQSIPEAGLRLLDVIRNVTGRAVRLVSREILDAQNPDWHTSAGAAVIKHYSVDLRDPKRFYVFPPATASAAVEVLYSVPPTACADETSTVGISDIYVNQIVDLMMFRAYSKDAEYAGNAAKADACMKRAMDLLGAKTAIDIAADATKSQSNLINPNAR